MKDVLEDQIRVRAYQLWELAGMPEGKEEQCWLEAERELREKQIREQLKAPDSP
jgi:hypothetical protein